jgi:hypothetical protein
LPRSAAYFSSLRFSDSDWPRRRPDKHDANSYIFTIVAQQLPNSK